MTRENFLVALAATLLALVAPDSFANFTVRAVQEEVSEQGWVVRYKIEACGAAFSLNPPPRWTSEKNTGQSQVTFRSEALQSSLGVRFTTNVTARTARELKGVVQERWPTAEIKETGIQHARDRSGLMVEFKWRASTGETYQSRLVILDYSRAAAEITLSAPESIFAKSHAGWTQLLNSFGLDLGK